MSIVAPYSHAKRNEMMGSKTTMLNSSHQTSPSKRFFLLSLLRKTNHDNNDQPWNPALYGKRLPLFYLIFMNLFAMVGYYFVLLFPALFLICIYKTYVLFLQHPYNDSMATVTLLWLTLSLFFGHISFNIITINFAAIPGLEIKRKSALVLYKLLHDIQQYYPKAKIKQIIVSGNFELKLVKVPFTGIPLFHRNVLVVGMPLMMTLSPNQFQCLCTREIIQYSNNRPFSATWINQLRDTWNRYRVTLKPQSCIGHQVLYWFFYIYSPLYNVFSLPARLSDELNADRNALDLVNSDELLSALQASMRANNYLRKDFWPRIEKTSKCGSNGVRPLSLLSRTAKSVLMQNNSNEWLKNHYIKEECTNKQLPPLKQRMDNLGLSELTLPPDLKQTAAEYYFQDHYAKLIVMSDNNWLETQCRRVAAKRTAAMPEKLFNNTNNTAKTNHEMTKNSKANVV